MQDILLPLKVQALNAGAYSSTHGWSTISESTFSSYNPADGSVIASISPGNAQDLEHMISTAEQNFLNWRTLPAPKRGDMIRALAQEIRQYKELLGALISLEMGKSRQESLGEVQEMLDIADFAIGLSRMLYGNTMHSERPQHRMYEQWHPLGVIGVITAFNFPMAVWSWNAFIAAVAGNTIIWKPSPKTSLCAIALQHLCNRVMQQYNAPGVFSLFITDDNILAKTLVADRRIPLISFTGSTKVGYEVQSIVAQRLGRSLLELGGNNAIIIDESADLKAALPAIVFGAVGTAGQRCTTTRRLIIHESIYFKVTTALVDAYAKITIGDPLNEKNLLGPLIDASAVQHYQHAMTEIKRAGGKILFGGEVIPGPGYFVQPTLVAAENHWPIVQQETFAPILYLMSYQHLNDAIALQNAVPQGLSSALFTQKLSHAELFLSAAGSDCGIANINLGTSGAEIGGAFGGEKETGGGREAGSDVWKTYMRRQTNTINWGSEQTLAQGIKFEL